MKDNIYTAMEKKWTVAIGNMNEAHIFMKKAQKNVCSYKENT